MKKVVKLTENDLTSIVRKVIKEQMEDLMNDKIKSMENLTYRQNSDGSMTINFDNKDIGMIMKNHYDNSIYLLSLFVKDKNSIAQRLMTMRKSFTSIEEVMNFLNQNFDKLIKKYNIL